MMHPRDRRNHRRHLVNIPATLCAESQRDAVIRATITDASDEGLFLRSETLLRPGTRVFIHIIVRLPSWPRGFLASGIVVRQEKYRRQGPGMAVRLDAQLSDPFRAAHLR